MVALTFLHRYHRFEQVNGRCTLHGLYKESDKCRFRSDGLDVSQSTSFIGHNATQLVYDSAGQLACPERRTTNTSGLRTAACFSAGTSPSPKKSSIKFGSKIFTSNILNENQQNQRAHRRKHFEFRYSQIQNSAAYNTWGHAGHNFTSVFISRVPGNNPRGPGFDS